MVILLSTYYCCWIKFFFALSPFLFLKEDRAKTFYKFFFERKGDKIKSSFLPPGLGSGTSFQPQTLTDEREKYIVLSNLKFSKLEKLYEIF